MISVIVPTYLRPAELTRCIGALAAQVRHPDEVIVVMREGDDQSRQAIAAFDLPWLRVVSVSAPGVVAAMNAGLGAARGDIIALTDDDAAPHSDWLQRIETAFASDPLLGGFGGRDYLFLSGKLLDGQATQVGELSWFGRLSAGHHVAVGPPREVDVLKGVNCAYRAGPLRKIGFDTRLAGTGAQVHWELSLGLSLKRAGWKLVLDPGLAVDHYPAQRFDEDQRGRLNSLALRNAAANETLAILEHLRGIRRAAFVVWAALIGTSGSPGFAQFFRLLLRREPGGTRRFLATMSGRAKGLGMYRCDRFRRQATCEHRPAPGPDLHQQGVVL